MIFDNVTQPPSTENPSKPTPSFLKLIAEMSQLSLPGAAGETKEGLVGGVEHFLTLLKSDNSPIVPRVDLINKSLQALLEAGQPGKVLAIVDEMRRQCKLSLTKLVNGISL